jgi:hypothetical protein
MWFRVNEFEKEQPIRLDHLDKKIQSFPEVFDFLLESPPREEFQHPFYLKGRIEFSDLNAHSLHSESSESGMYSSSSSATTFSLWITYPSMISVSVFAGTHNTS